MNIVICDDEINFVKEFENIIKAYLKDRDINSNIITSTKPLDLRKNIQEINPDLVFLDIDMPGMNGFLLSKEIKKYCSRCIVVFCTNHNELVYDSFEYEPFWFLYKLEYKERIERILDKACKKIKKEKAKYLIHLKDEIIMVRYSKIIYIDVDKHKLQFHISGGNIIKKRGTIGEIKDIFEICDFIKINSGCLVNSQYIHHIKNNIILLKNNESLVISRSNKKKVREAFYKYITDGIG